MMFQLFVVSNFFLHDSTNIDNSSDSFILVLRRTNSLYPVQNMLLLYFWHCTFGWFGTFLFLVWYEWFLTSDQPLWSVSAHWDTFNGNRLFISRYPNLQFSNVIIEGKLRILHDWLPPIIFTHFDNKLFSLDLCCPLIMLPHTDKQ